MKTKKRLKKMYGNECMLTKDIEELTYHHIQKKCEGGKVTIENGSVLSRAVQDWLHNNIERNDPELYELINECLIIYKEVYDYNIEELLRLWDKEVVPLVTDKIESNGHKVLVRRRRGR